MTHITYADILRPSDRRYSAVYDITVIVGFSILIALSAQLSVFLPFTPVPVTGQTFAVLLSGSLLGSRRGLQCILLYLTEGLVGLPVFAGGGAGPATLLGPTGGYLIGFVAAAYITGFLTERGWDRRVETTFLSMIFGTIAIYAFGLLWLAKFVGFEKVLALGLYPYLAAALLKIVLATSLLPLGWKILKHNKGKNDKDE